MRSAPQSVKQVFEFRVDEREHDRARSVQDGRALERSSRFGAPGFRLKGEVDRVERHRKEVSNEGHGLRCQPRNKTKKILWIEKKKAVKPSSNKHFHSES